MLQEKVQFFSFHCRFKGLKGAEDKGEDLPTLPSPCYVLDAIGLGFDYGRLTKKSAGASLNGKALQ
jgi:hypothetical protein